MNKPLRLALYAGTVAGTFFLSSAPAAAQDAAPRRPQTDILVGTLDVDCSLPAAQLQKDVFDKLVNLASEARRERKFGDREIGMFEELDDVPLPLIHHLKQRRFETLPETIPDGINQYQIRCTGVPVASINTKLTAG